MLLLVSTILSMTTPFTYQGDGLINSSTGIMAPPDIMKDLATSHDRGVTASKEYIQSHLTDNDAERDIFMPIKSQKRKTFSRIIRNAF